MTAFARIEREADGGVRVAPPPVGAVRVPGVPARRHAGPMALAVLVLAGLVLRSGQVGNAIAGLDEQLYLLIGDRMWHGELPYVDLWDRKPFGLFLIFAAIRALPGDGVVAAQLVASAFAVATAWLVACFCRRWTGWAAAAMAGVFYLGGLNELWVETTQSPVFYDLPVMGAALLALRGVEATSARDRGRAGVLAMLLAGAAIQIKTNAVFQGGWFGLWIVGASWRRSRDVAQTAALALRLGIVGLLPTLAVAGFFAGIGAWGAWWQANVLSVLAKGMPTDAAAVTNLANAVILTAPVWLLAILGLWARTARFARWRPDTLFVAGWVVLAAVDFAAVGGYYPHYAVPFLLACCPLVACAFALRRIGAALFVAAIGWPVFHAAVITPRISAREQGYARAVVAALPADVRTRCLFVYEGPVAYYTLTQACRVTRFPFTAHLGSRRESRSLGVDPLAELRGVFARRPGTVLTVEHSTWPDRNPAADRVVARELAAHYRLARRLPHRSYAPGERLLIWRRTG